MAVFLGGMTLAGSIFLYLWYRTVVSLPVRQQPPFIHGFSFKWGIPSLSLILLAIGTYILALTAPWIAVLGVMISILIVLLFLKYDRYTAAMRIIFDRYQTVRRQNPEMEEAEVLYFTARWRYPRWDHDRLVELIAGKDIEALILLMLISENNINPISDWELYRVLKTKAARVTRSTKEVPP